MPRVNTKKKNKVGEYRCDACSNPIIGGQTYYEWSFRYGGTHRQHESHGRPKASQLTQSKLSGVYSAVESAESAINDADNVDDIRAALEECASEVESVKDEYQESLDNMISQDGSVAQDVQEKIDALESFIDELNNVAGDMDEFDEDEPEEPETSEVDPVAHSKWKDEEPDYIRFGEGEQSTEHKAWEEREPKGAQDEDAREAWEKEHADWEEERDGHLEDKRSAASDALGSLSI